MIHYVALTTIRVSRNDVCKDTEVEPSIDLGNPIIAVPILNRGVKVRAMNLVMLPANKGDLYDDTSPHMYPGIVVSRIAGTDNTNIIVSFQLSNEALRPTRRLEVNIVPRLEEVLGSILVSLAKELVPGLCWSVLTPGQA